MHNIQKSIHLLEKTIIHKNERLSIVKAKLEETIAIVGKCKGSDNLVSLYLEILNREKQYIRNIKKQLRHLKNAKKIQ